MAALNRCHLWYAYLVLAFALTLQSNAEQLNVKQWANDLSAHLQAMFETATKHREIVKIYEKLASAEVFQPHAELRASKRQIEAYLRDRAKMAWDAKVSLESRELRNLSRTGVNDPMSRDFVRFLDAKKESDSTVVFKDGHMGESFFVNETREYELKPNVNFYGIRTSSEASAVHVPTPVYKRSPYVLKRIDWSNIDQVYRRNRERMKDLSFQKFCSESGFMRYFPAAPWRWDSKGLDLFDCRSTEWFIDAATMSKNVLIMLDLSGSMLGQRFEIAKQTIEAVLDTLYDNDFFNVLAFSKSAHFLDDCATDSLIQATMRNKKLIWSKLTNVTAEGKADYEIALPKAFTTLMNLQPSKLEWRSKEDVEREKQEFGGLDPEKEYIQLSEHVLVVDKHYVQAINNFTGNAKMGCNDVIMLITDGAPGFFKQTFELYNRQKHVRFFSFLVGEEATDFEQVRWMACNNRGFMVHISNLADIQEKIQHYVRVLSRPISYQSQNINQESAVWSSIARERMSNEFVISVGYPVITEEGFMGVSSVSIPLIELEQIAHPSLIGAHSYYFMLDNNGYTMFHPQLDQFDEVTGEVKPIFNNLDFSEIEITPPMHKKPRPGFINCDDTATKELTILFATDDIRRVYRQKNTYHSECIDGTQFTLGLAVAEEDDVRLNRKGLMSWKDVDMDWMRGQNWRLHPKWRYCLLNDSDTHLTPEAAFAVYAKQMREYGELPLLCRARRRLVDRVLLDLQATSDFDQLWTDDWQRSKESGVHLVFFAMPSGLIRFVNETVDDVDYKRAAENLTYKTFGYRHFILEMNRNAVESTYYKRAVRQKGKILFDVNRNSHLWYKNGSTTPYGKKENVSLLGLAYRAIYANDALVGVSGVEFLYDKLVERMKAFGCTPGTDAIRCFLIDEHAYVVYSSQADVEYTELVRNISKTSAPLTKQKRIVGAFFGKLNRVTEWTMEVLIKKGFYTETTYWDNQAMCDQAVPQSASGSELKAIYQQLYHLFKYLVRVLHCVCTLFRSLSLTSPFTYSVTLTEAYTTTFKTTVARLPCRTKSKFYLANTERKGPATAALLEENYAERPCKENAAQCAVKVYATWVEGTNLLFVVIKQGHRSSCYDDKHCPLAKTVSFGFERLTPLEVKQRDPLRTDSDELDDESEGPRVQCPSTRPTHRKTIAQCLKEPSNIIYEEDEHIQPCSYCYLRMISISILSLMLSLNWLL